MERILLDLAYLDITILLDFKNMANPGSLGGYAVFLYFYKIEGRNWELQS